MDRLPVFKALGDNTRYAIYLELARAASPLSTGDIAEALDLHPNTVRPHLERMRDVGLLDVESDSRGAVGRPQHLYSLAADAPSLGLEPSAFRLLARLVADVAARAGLTGDDVAEVGREHGRVAGAAAGVAAAGVAAAGVAAAGVAAAGVAAAGVAAAGVAAPVAAPVAAADRCLLALTHELAELGFDPVVGQDGLAATVAFTHCPFRELAEAYPGVVCHLHRGIVEGFVESMGGTRVTRFGTLDDRNPCEVDLVAG